MSYAKNVAGHDDPTPFNHFVVFDALNVLACHDFKVSLAYSRGFVKESAAQNLAADSKQKRICRMSAGMAIRISLASSKLPACLQVLLKEGLCLCST